MSKYLTFPVGLLSGGPNNVSRTMTNAMHYALYYYCETNDGDWIDLVDAAGDYLGVTYKDKRGAYNQGRLLYESIGQSAPKTSITTKMAFQFRDETKTEFELITFIAYAALKSIIQKQGYTKISNAYLLSRMAGNAGKDGEFPEWINKYTTRYQIDKIKLELQLNWGLKLYGQNCRGYYVSFSMDQKDLIKHALERSNSSKRRALKERNKEAFEAAMREVQANL